ncbi:MAG: hypothetical protein K0U12_02500 [Gammaproteobacteria bacterium]|nr:hypothetical protein [Gammaproteobacteria bacterium]
MRYTINMYDQTELLFEKSSDDLNKLTRILFDFIDTSNANSRAFIYDRVQAKVIRRCSKSMSMH